jgi:2-polyprenyl-6-methoxyphenol hydroxylase-like FAD-dependent oxidoreductase
VLIVGAGPTVLVLALWLTRLGVNVRIIDKAAEPGTTSRALAAQTRTLEFYQQIGLSTTVVERGVRPLAAHFWVRGAKVVRARFGDGGVGSSPFPYALVYPQDEHERMLTERPREIGVIVMRSTGNSTSVVIETRDRRDQPSVSLLTSIRLLEAS